MMSKEVVAPAGEVTKSRRRRRRAGARAAKKRARKTGSVTSDVASPIKCAVHAFLLRYQSALRRIPTQLPPKVHAGPPSKRVKRVSWCHEDGGIPSGGGGDPAVLAVGPSRRALTYTRDELMRLRHSPLVKKGLEDAFAGCENLALVLKKRSDSPNEEDRGGRGDAPSENHKGVYGRERDRERRSADPRERVRKESEPSSGIVLSPQRRSFTSGCGAPAAAAPPPHVARTRPDSPLSNAVAKPEPGVSVARFERDAGGRRIGSGRLMMPHEPVEREPRSGGNGRLERERERQWERDEEHRERVEPYRPPPQQQRLNGDRYDRRSFGRDSYSSDIKREREDRFNNDKMRDRDDNRRSGGRYSNRRFDKDDEPEWFSGGPTSQHDTIELHGFEEHEKKKQSMKNGNANNKEADKWNNSNSSASPAPDRWRETSSPLAPPNDSANSSNVSTNNDKDSGVDSKTEEPQQNNEHEFNLEEFLKDEIPDVLKNGGGEAEGSSRFSQWFRRESPTNDFPNFERILHNMVDELDNPPRAGGGSEQHVFAPISPARPPPSLMDLLLRANEPRPPPQDSGSAGKVHSLEELESRLRPQSTHHSVPDHDLTAFKRLLAQVSGGHAVAADSQRPTPQPQPHQPMSLLQMLNKSMEQQQQQQQKVQQQQQQQQPPVIPPDLVYKLLHVQQRQQQTEQMNAHLGADRELLQRPEAQAILHGLKSGEITATHLMQQLGNPGLQSRHREMLLTILRMQQHQHQRQMQGAGSPLPMGGAPPHLVVPPHHQPLRLSPLPHQAVHTQSIMQNALIKKKLEEQRENYNRRRAEILHQPKQSTPISFTPTSVLRKMTAEKESETPSPKQQWNTQPKMPQIGRPIVKGNQSGGPAMSYTPQPDYPQHYMNQPQQQMINNIRPFPHSQNRQLPSNNFNNMNNMGRAMPANTTLHQLLAQSHQRSLNDLISEMGNVGAGGGDNQLARWFSPELLARASAGKLPSVHVPNALSLEDLERHHHSPAPIVRN